MVRETKVYTIKGCMNGWMDACMDQNFLHRYYCTHLERNRWNRAMKLRMKHKHVYNICAVDWTHDHRLAIKYATAQSCSPPTVQLKKKVWVCSEHKIGLVCKGWESLKWCCRKLGCKKWTENGQVHRVYLTILPTTGSQIMPCTTEIDVHYCLVCQTHDLLETRLPLINILLIQSHELIQEMSTFLALLHPG